MLLLIGGIFVGALIVAMGEHDEEQENKYIKR